MPVGVFESDDSTIVLYWNSYTALLTA